MFSAVCSRSDPRNEPFMADQIVITEKTSQAKDIRAAVGSRYGAESMRLPIRPMRSAHLSPFVQAASRVTRLCRRVALGRLSGSFLLGRLSGAYAIIFDHRRARERLDEQVAH